MIPILEKLLDAPNSMQQLHKTTEKYFLSYPFCISEGKFKAMLNDLKLDHGKHLVSEL